MKGEAWQRLKPLLLAALDLMPSERASFLETELGDEEALYAEALRLLSRLEAEVGENEQADEGRTIAGYELREQIGRGGVGVVHRAFDARLGREVALKLLALGPSADPQQVDRFRREARAAGRLNHPGVVRVLDVDEEHGQWFIASELIDGHDLAEEIRLQAGTSPEAVAMRILPPHGDRAFLPAAASVIAHVADALEAAHGSGIVHRDVKPQNLLLARDGVIKLTDFGLARDASLGSITQTGAIEGTPFYMSPEQVQGRRHQVDQRTDVYSLGVVLYELLTLRRPFEGTTSRQVIAQIESVEPPPPRQVNSRIPRDLALVCKKAMSRDVSGRYASASAFASDLRRFLGHEAVLAQPPSLWKRATTHVRRRRAAYGIALGASVLILLTVVASAALGQRQERARSLLDVEEILLNRGELNGLADRLPGLLKSALALRQSPHVGTHELRQTNDAITLVDEHGRSLEDEGRRLIAEGLGERGGGLIAASASKFFLGLQRLKSAQALRPDDDVLARAADGMTYRPRLEIDGFHRSSTGAQDFQRDFQQEFQRAFVTELLGGGSLGPRIDLDAGDVGGSPLVPGIYRVTVVGKAGHAELSRTLHERGRRYQVSPVIRNTTDVTADMVLIPAGDAWIGDPRWNSGDSRRWKARRQIEHPGFWIARHEVTNAEFDLFVEATGAGIPTHWTATPASVRPDDWDQRPVFGVSFGEAQSYAHWSGRRLVTDQEWQIAVRGREGFAFPWGNEKDAAPGAIRTDTPAAPEPLAVLEDPPWRGYLSGVGAVGTAAGDVSPFGIRDGLGNVREWTETPVQASILDWPGAPATPSLVFGMRRIRGGDWTSPTFRDLNALGMATTSATAAGIRCGKSLPPKGPSGD
ncbi:MAG: serine/threonine protein kinase/formylglycine-generating enzyme required for sulfatase activity [Planctomycetota bacterium]|jgi:serine/threonine protein kinase/formylglycine-generating enzyme required for sulfatase activity